MTFESTLAYTTLHPYFHQRVRSHEPLALHSSFGVGGPADIWLTLETRQELSDLINLCARERWPLLLVGMGSNILYADAGVRGIVASITLQRYHLEEQSDESALLIAEPGVRWAQLLKELVPLGWGGLEFGIGIPGTLGAGIISNVGAHNQDLGQALEWIEELDARACNREMQEPSAFPVTVLRRYQRDELDLRYRHSRFRDHTLTHVHPDGHIVFSPRGLIEPAELVVTLALRLHLEQAGMAGRRNGNAQMSERNANYIVNLGGASAADIEALIVEAHQAVLSHHGIHLALNIELLGERQAE